VSNADLGPVLVKFIADNCSVDQLLRKHMPDASGHCPTCHTVGCTVFNVARWAKRSGPTS
jgi:hypothetical protein